MRHRFLRRSLDVPWGARRTAHSIFLRQFPVASRVAEHIADTIIPRAELIDYKVTKSAVPYRNAQHTNLKRREASQLPLLPFAI
jgi:hypothetical protein